MLMLINDVIHHLLLSGWRGSAGTSASCQWVKAGQHPGPSLYQDREKQPTTLTHTHLQTIRVPTCVFLMPEWKLENMKRTKKTLVEHEENPAETRRTGLREHKENPEETQRTWKKLNRNMENMERTQQTRWEPKDNPADTWRELQTVQTPASALHGRGRTFSGTDFPLRWPCSTCWILRSLELFTVTEK